MINSLGNIIKIDKKIKAYKRQEGVEKNAKNNNRGSMKKNKQETKVSKIYYWKSMYTDKKHEYIMQVEFSNGKGYSEATCMENINKLAEQAGIKPEKA